MATKKTAKKTAKATQTFPKAAGLLGKQFVINRDMLSYLNGDLGRLMIHGKDNEDTLDPIMSAVAAQGVPLTAVAIYRDADEYELQYKLDLMNGDKYLATVIFNRSEFMDYLIPIPADYKYSAQPIYNQLALEVCDIMEKEIGPIECEDKHTCTCNGKCNEFDPGPDGEDHGSAERFDPGPDEDANPLEFSEEDKKKVERFFEMIETAENTREEYKKFIKKNKGGKIECAEDFPLELLPLLCLVRHL